MLFLPGGEYDQCFLFPSVSVSTSTGNDVSSLGTVNLDHVNVRDISTVVHDHDYIDDRMEISPKRPQSDVSKVCPTTGDVVHDVRMEISPDRLQADIPEVCASDFATPCRKRQRQLSSKKISGTRAKNLLREINIKNNAELTPRKRFLYKTAAQLRQSNNKLDKRCLSFKQRLQAAESFSESSFFEILMAQLDKSSYDFVMCQIRNKKLKPKGRRFTTDDKIMALSLYKQSGKGYRLLSKMFALPSRKTIMSLLTNIPFNTGVNTKFLNNLKSTVQKLKVQDRNCVLLFDEVAIAANLEYNKHRDEVDGFEDQGSGIRTNHFANHALVFMVRGISKKYKQPVAYFFTTSQFKSASLVRLIKWKIMYKNVIDVVNKPKYI